MAFDINGHLTKEQQAEGAMLEESVRRQISNAMMYAKWVDNSFTAPKHSSIWDSIFSPWEMIKRWHGA